MKFLLLLLCLLWNDSTNNRHSVYYDNIELNIVLDKNKQERFRQFIFWKDGLSQGYVTLKQEEFIDGPIKQGDYYVVTVRHKKIYYLLKSKTLHKTITNYDVEVHDLRTQKKLRLYNVRQW